MLVHVTVIFELFGMMLGTVLIRETCFVGIALA